MITIILSQDTTKFCFYLKMYCIPHILDVHLKRNRHPHFFHSVVMVLEFIECILVCEVAGSNPIVGTCT